VRGRKDDDELLFEPSFAHMDEYYAESYGQIFVIRHRCLTVSAFLPFYLSGTHLMEFFVRQEFMSLCNINNIMCGGVNIIKLISQMERITMLN
jgi:hypothetical protein